MRIMPRNVCTHWNSTYDMLKFVLEYKEAIKMFTSDLKNDLRKFKLNNKEWGLVKELSNTLRVTWHNKQHNSDTHCFPLSLYPSLFTLIFRSFRFWRMGQNSSHMEHPLTAVISAMDHIDKNFTEQTQPTSKMHPTIQYALTLAKKTLNHYYSLTDHVKVYRIAMSTFLTITLNTDHNVSSSSSTAQTQLLSCCRLAIGMDWNCWSTHMWPIWQDLL